MSTVNCVRRASDETSNSSGRSVSRWSGDPDGEDVAHSRRASQTGAAHLTRWRGHALASSGHPDAITVLTNALDKHNTNSPVRKPGCAPTSSSPTLPAANATQPVQHLAAGRQMANAVGSAQQRDRPSKGIDST